MTQQQRQFAEGRRDGTPEWDTSDRTIARQRAFRGPGDDVRDEEVALRFKLPSDERKALIESDGWRTDVMAAICKIAEPEEAEALRRKRRRTRSSRRSTREARRCSGT
eukprot:jgi/Tetstr1/458303/TSEL_000342.t1